MKRMVLGFFVVVFSTLGISCQSGGNRQKQSATVRPEANAADEATARENEVKQALARLPLIPPAWKRDVIGASVATCTAARIVDELDGLRLKVAGKPIEKQIDELLRHWGKEFVETAILALRRSETINCSDGGPRGNFDAVNRIVLVLDSIGTSPEVVGSDSKELRAFFVLAARQEVAELLPRVATSEDARGTLISLIEQFGAKELGVSPQDVAKINSPN